MEGNNPDNKVLKKYAQEVQSEKLPPPRFDHIVKLISKTSIVILGGAITIFFGLKIPFFCQKKGVF